MTLRLVTDYMGCHYLGVGDSEWLYRCQFDSPATSSANVSTSQYELQFDGLDTLCDVYLVRVLISLRGPDLRTI
jgi:hypothetical protein